jgi:hypothetical protein
LRIKHLSFILLSVSQPLGHLLRFNQYQCFPIFFTTRLSLGYLWLSICGRGQSLSQCNYSIFKQLRMKHLSFILLSVSQPPGHLLRFNQY